MRLVLGAKVSSSRFAPEQALHLGDVLGRQPRAVRTDPRVGRFARKYQWIDVSQDKKNKTSYYLKV